MTPQRKGPDPDVLTDMQKNFAREYIFDFNASQAVIRAGYSPNAAGTQGSQLLKMEKVRTEIVNLLKERRKEYNISVERVKEEFARIAFADATIALDMDQSVGGKIVVKDIYKIPPRLRPAIQSIKQTKDGVEIKFHDKVAALEALGKHFGFFEEDNKQRLPAGIAIYLPENGRGGKVAILIDQQPAQQQIEDISHEEVKNDSQENYLQNPEEGF